MKIKKYIKQLFEIFYGIYPPFFTFLLDSYQHRRIRKRISPISGNAFYPVAGNILVDVTTLDPCQQNTGIQRVVCNILYHLSGQKGTDIVPVCCIGDSLVTAFHSLRLDICEKRVLPEISVCKLLLLDLSLNSVRFYDRLLAHNGQSIDSYGVIYDLFPIQYPELFDGRSFVDRFTCWVRFFFTRCNAVICISKTVADHVIAYYRSLDIKRENPLRVYYFHMGADIVKHGGHIQSELKGFLLREGITFLMVGTVEPRKGHLVVLEAMEKLQEENINVRLLVLGKNGWKNKDVINKMQSSNVYKKNVHKKKELLWIQDASDAEISWSYQNASALIAASKDEGFGLPLIEAAYYGLPVICSDIPVFHEVLKDKADYFSPMDPVSLEKTLTAWIHTDVHPDPHEVRIYSWAESAGEVMDIIQGKQAPYETL